MSGFEAIINLFKVIAGVVIVLGVYGYLADSMLKWLERRKDNPKIRTEDFFFSLLGYALVSLFLSLPLVKWLDMDFGWVFCIFVFTLAFFRRT